MTFKEVVDEFNGKAWEEGLGFRLQYEEDIVPCNKLIRASIVVANANGIKYPDGIYITEKARTDLMAFFLINGVKLNWNNTGQIIWEDKR